MPPIPSSLQKHVYVDGTLQGETTPISLVYK